MCVNKYTYTHIHPCAFMLEFLYNCLCTSKNWDQKNIHI